MGELDVDVSSTLDANLGPQTGPYDPEPAASEPASEPEASPEPEAAPAEKARDDNGRFAKSEETDPDRIPDEEWKAMSDAQRSYFARIRKERDEARQGSEKAKRYEDAFAGMHPEDADAVLGFVQLLQQDPAAAAAWMRENADALSPAQEKAMERAAQAANQPEAAPSAQDEDEFDPYDQERIAKLAEERAEAKFQELMAQREQAAAVESARAEIEREAKDLGYSPEGDDAWRYKALLLRARDEFNGDLRKAHEALEADATRRAQALLKAKAEEAERKVPPEEGRAPAGRSEPRSMADAEKAMKERLKHTTFR